MTSHARSDKIPICAAKPSNTVSPDFAAHPLQRHREGERHGEQLHELPPCPPNHPSEIAHHNTTNAQITKPRFRSNFSADSGLSARRTQTLSCFLNESVQTARKFGTTCRHLLRLRNRLLHLLRLPPRPPLRLRSRLRRRRPRPHPRCHKQLRPSARKPAPLPDLR